MEQLAPGIEDLTRRLNVSLQSIDGFGVAKGPGSFSGIRVGMALVKGLCLVLQRPVVGVSSLEILAWGGLQDGEIGAAVIDARRKELYTSVYAREGSKLRCLSQPALIPHARLRSVAQEFGAGVIVTGESPFWEDQEIMSFAVRQIDPENQPVWCAELARAYIDSGTWDGLHQLVPLYVRRSDAEEKRASV